MKQVEIVRPGKLSPLERQTWAAFQAAQPAFYSPLLSPEFAEAVGRVREDAAVAVFRRDGRITGFLAHHRRPGGFARPIGAVWSDYQAFIGEPGAAADGAQALRAAGVAIYRFNGLLDPEGVFAAAGGSAHDAYGMAVRTSGEDYWESRRALSPKRFKNLRRLESKLEREVGPVALIPNDRAREHFELMVGWKRDQLRRTGCHDVLGADWSGALMRQLFARQEDPLQGLMLTLTVAGRPIAAHFGVRQGAAFHPWIAAFDPEFAAYSPGWMFMSHAVRAMPGLGLARYDLSAGHEHYKLPLASERVALLDGAARGAHASASLDGALALAGRRLGGRTGPMVERVRRRLDQIASVELSLAGRVHGVATALASGGRRAPEAAAGPEPASQA